MSGWHQHSTNTDMPTNARKNQKPGVVNYHHALEPVLWVRPNQTDNANVMAAWITSEQTGVPPQALPSAEPGIEPVLAAHRIVDRLEPVKICPLMAPRAEMQISTLIT